MLPPSQMALFIWVFHKCIILNICNILMFLNLIIAKVFSVLEFAQDIVDWEPLKIQKNSIFYHSSSHHNEKILQSYESTFESRTQTIFKSAPGIFLLVFLIWFPGVPQENRIQSSPLFLSWNNSNLISQHFSSIKVGGIWTSGLNITITVVHCLRQPAFGESEQIA